MVAMREIQEFADAVAREFSPQRIILFGSHARGRPTRDSDVDLLVIMPHRGHPVEQAIKIRTRLDCPFALDLLVRSPAEIRRRIEIDDWFIRDIVEQGKVLYAAEDQGVGRKGGGRPSKRRTLAASSKVAKL